MSASEQQSLDTGATIIKKLVSSVFVLWYLLHNSYKLTPEFFHFIVCLTDYQGDLLWVFGLWACFKVGFTARGKRQACQDSVLATFEMLIALALSG